MIERVSGVLLDHADASYLAEAMHQVFGAMASCGLTPRPAWVSAQQKLAKACVGASESGRDTHADAREVGAQQDSTHTALYDLVDTNEAAKILGCTAANVRDLRRRKRIPAHHAGGRWVYPAAVIVARAEKQAARRAPRPE